MDSILVVGQGYVGLPLAMRAIEVGYQVVGFDVDAARVDRLRNGNSFVEDVSEETLRGAISTGRYIVTDDLADCANFDVAVITVPTPLRESLPDLTYVETAARTVGALVRPGNTVILESTTYPGTTEEIMVPILEAASGLRAGIDFFAGYSPERIDPGNQTWTFRTTPKVVSGVNTPSLDHVSAFYRTLVDKVIATKGCKEAELTKLLENTFRHVNVALVNELAIFATDLDIDIWDAIEAASSKPFGFMRFTPGPGVGGHCLPIDPSYLSWRVRQTLGQNFRFVELANDVNDHMPDHVVHRAVQLLNRERKAVNGSRIVVFGVAYKKNSGDARESPAVVVSAKLALMGADVLAVDPHVVEPPRGLGKVALVTSASDADLANADLTLILTDHDRFDYAQIVANAPLIFDARNRCGVAPNVERL